MTKEKPLTPSASPLSDGLGYWGRGDLMAIAAVRYCLGRRTYIVSDCSEWLIVQWPNICKRAQVVIQRDIEREFLDDDAARTHGGGHRPLGDDCDRAAWEKVRLLWMSSNAELSRAGSAQNETADVNSAGLNDELYVTI